MGSAYVHGVRISYELQLFVNVPQKVLVSVPPHKSNQTTQSATGLADVFSVVN
jgi:hypothetical protein